MILDLVYATLGLIILVLAGDSLVRGAVNVSLRLGVPALIVSLTIVAIGTSAPELLIAVSAIYEGAPGIALGNVVGSNTANILLVLGLPALMAGLNTANCDTRTSYLQMLFGTVVFVAAAAMGPINWVVGLLMLGIFVLFMLHAIHMARSHRRDARLQEPDDLDVEGVDPAMRWPKIFLLIGLGLIGLPLGADILVVSATNIARSMDISETVIGLTLVAVGTSLPELATTVSAALRKQADVALGNVIGSNMANLLGIMGIASLFGEIPVPREILHYDILIMVAASVLIAPFVLGRMNINRVWGAGFLIAYVVYVVTLF